MKWFRRHKALVIVSCAVLFVLGFSLSSLLAGGGAMPVSNGIGIILWPFQNLAAKATASVNDFYGALYELDALREENDALRMRLSEREQNERDFQALQEENKRLKQLCELKERRPEFKFEDADIVARDLSNWSKTFTLNRGSNAGISAGQCVISSEGYLVGIVKEVGLNWCVVNSVIDTDVSLGATVHRTGFICVAEGNFSQMQNGFLTLTLLPLEIDLLKDDVVLTGGAGTMYPKDIPIGTVRDVFVESDGLSATAVLQPYSKLENLTKVFIITEFDAG